MSKEFPSLYFQQDTGSSGYIHKISSEDSETSETNDPFHVFDDRRNTITSSHVLSLSLNIEQQTLLLDPRFAQANAGLLVTQAECGKHPPLPQNFNNATNFGMLMRFYKSQYDTPPIADLIQGNDTNSIDDLDYKIQLSDLCRFPHASNSLREKNIREAFAEKTSGAIIDWLQINSWKDLIMPRGLRQKISGALDIALEQDIKAYELYGSYYGEHGFVGCWQGGLDKEGNIVYIPGSPELAPLSLVTKAQKVRIDYMDKTYGLTLFYVPGKLYRRE